MGWGGLGDPLAGIEVVVLEGGSKRTGWKEAGGVALAASLDLLAQERDVAVLDMGPAPVGEEPPIVGVEVPALEQHEVAVAGLGGEPPGEEDSTSVLRVQWNWGNRVVGARWQNAVGSSWVADTRLGHSTFSDQLGFVDFDGIRFGSSIAQTTLRKVVGQHTLDETLSETDRINVNIREILDVATAEDKRTVQLRFQPTRGLDVPALEA